MAELKSKSTHITDQAAFGGHDRTIDYRRHIHDLRTRSYEGAVSREDREEVFRRAFDLVTPVARRVLAEINDSFLSGSGRIRVVCPTRTEEGGLIGFWEMSWSLQEQARNRFNQEPLQPLAIHAVFPLRPTLGMEWTHPHFAMLRPCCKEGFAAAWPMQVVSEEDAWRQEAILRVLAEGELHQQTFLADLNWKLLSSLYETE
ncbi:MAG: hypothetical protein ACRD20_20055 [Terriglobales bacterium]